MVFVEIMEKFINAKGTQECLTPMCLFYSALSISQRKFFIVFYCFVNVIN